MRLPPEAEVQIDSVVQNLLKLLIAAFATKHNSGARLATQNVNPTEFDIERRWWVEKDDSNIVFDQTDVADYYTLTDIPPENAYLSLTISGINIELCFIPRS